MLLDPPADTQCGEFQQAVNPFQAVGIAVEAVGCKHKLHLHLPSQNLPSALSPTKASTERAKLNDWSWSRA